MGSMIDYGVNDTDTIPARMINEYVYCPRLFYLEFVQGDFIESEDTLMGKEIHKHVDVEKGQMSPPEEMVNEEGTNIHLTSVFLSGEKIGITARIDLIEGNNKKVYPVEYKKGLAPAKDKDVWPSDVAQITLNSIVLRENGYMCDEGYIYYAASKKRISVKVTSEIIKWVTDEVSKARELLHSHKIPPPLIDSPKCVGCSLVSICLPDETNSLEDMEDKTLEKEIRRLYPTRADSLPMYVQKQGSTVTKNGEEIIVKAEGGVIARGKLIEISQLSIFGNVQVTTQTIRELCRRNIPISYFSLGGWFTGITQGMSHKNVELRIRQYNISGDPEKSLNLASHLIEGKIKNSRTLLRRNSVKPNQNALSELRKLALSAREAKSKEFLLGIEGSAGRIYFQHFEDMIKINTSELKFHFEGRNRRPPIDPVNALLSFVYALLSKDVTVTLLAVGFDPYVGFYHKLRYGRPALALDMMEEFRPIIGDSVVISLINNEEITTKDFLSRGNATALTPNGRIKVINAYERRMDTLVNHPIFGYSVSYRRILEVQARLLSRFLLGEILQYPEFCTR
jgi:CRISPR-associated protein Cas1